MITKVEKVYRARISNGVILEDSDFKNVYKAALRELRVTYGHSLYFDYGFAELQYGVLTTVYQGSSVNAGFIVMRGICDLTVYSIDRVTHVITRKGV